MFGVAAFGGRIERRAARCLSIWTRDCLRAVALADLGCGLVGVFMAAQVRFGSNVTSMYLALPVLWVAALWLAGAYDVRFIGAGSDEYRKVLTAGASLTAAVAIFSYAVNLELSRGYVVITLSSITVFDLVARFVMRKRLHLRHARGKRLHNVVAVGHELAVADLVTELERGNYLGADTVAVTACPETDEARRVQLFNVLPGHMSLAGPRPALPDEAGKYAEYVRHRLVNKPGLTGLWQVSALVRRSGALTDFRR
jgi:hypothetical protein